PSCVRVLTALVLCSAAVFAGGWTSGATVAPPKCSDAWTSKVDTAWMQGHHLLWVSLPAIQTRQQPWATLTQFCGPATVNLRVGGRSVQVHSVYCDAPGSFWQYKLFVGLAGYVPAAPDKFFGLAVHDPRAAHGGTFTRAYMSLQLAGHSMRSINQRLSPPFP